jgi:predicted MPP superfamily phosphohydrolase
MALFLAVALTVWAMMHLYVFWRLSSVPWVAGHLARRTLFTAAAILWASYPIARIMDSWKLERIARPLEFVSANWIGILFLFLATLLATDVFTLGGWLLPQVAPVLPGWAAIAAVALSIIALVQGLRPPVVRHYEVALNGLPPGREGLVLVAVSDLHLGTLLGRRWLSRVINQVHSLRPDIIVVVGDLIDGNVDRVEPLLPLLKQLRAPFGVWAVTGNHEYYAGVEPSVSLLQNAGFSVLRDRSSEVLPGLVFAGVDDFTARAQFGFDHRQPLATALAGRPAGAAILLSHSPAQAEQAAAAGVSLMLSGHTHNGQLWPFSYLVALRYPLLGGRYQVNGMSVIVCRGTGTWGPRMRLWRPSEIVRIKLKATTQPAI